VLASENETLRTRVRLLERQLAELAAKEEEHRSELAQREDRIRILEEFLRLSRAKRFGASSEKAIAEQLGLWLFNEAEQWLDTEEIGAEEDEDDSVLVAAHPRRKPGRKPLPPELPRVEILHDLPEDEKVCAQGHALAEIGRDTSEQLEVIPAQLQVIRHVRPRYACPQCKDGVRGAPPPPQVIPKGQAGPGLLAYVATSKYVDAVPLYRQEQILQRYGIDLARASLVHWMVKLGAAVQPLLNLMRDDLLDSGFVQCDETRFQVLKEPGKRAQSQSYLWAQRGEHEGRSILLFDYDPSRSGEVPKRLLAGFEGVLQTDGYEGYPAVVSAQGLVHAGCWAHVRRKFDEALKGQGNPKNKPSGRKAKAGQALSYIRKLYQIDRKLAGLDPEERARERRCRAGPVLEELREWLDANLGEVTPQSLTGKALHYLDKQWPKLVRFLEDGRIPLDTNAVENAIRPFVMGRKNWLFADTVRGAESSANLYSLLQSAKANGHEPFAYLRHVLQRLPVAETADDYQALLPHRLAPDDVPPVVNHGDR